MSLGIDMAGSALAEGVPAEDDLWGGDREGVSGGVLAIDRIDDGDAESGTSAPTHGADKDADKDADNDADKDSFDDFAIMPSVGGSFGGGAFEDRAFGGVSSGDVSSEEGSSRVDGRRPRARKIDRGAGVGDGAGSTEIRSAARRRGGTTEMRVMQPLMLLAVSSGAIALGSRAEGAIVASWSMNGVSPASSSIQTADIGIGTVDFGAVVSGASALLGTTLGAAEGVAAGESLSIAGLALNGQAVELVFDSTGWGELMLTFATRRSSTGFASSRLEWWNGLAWTTVEKFSASTTAWELKSFDLASLDALEDRVSRLRIVLDGATGSTGSIRFDNFSVAGSAVPAPAGSIALLALAGCAARRRR